MATPWENKQNCGLRHRLLSTQRIARFVLKGCLLLVFDFHFVEPDHPVYVKRGYVAGGLVLRIDRHNSPHPVAFQIERETC